MEEREAQEAEENRREAEPDADSVFAKLKGVKTDDNA